MNKSELGTFSAKKRAFGSLKKVKDLPIMSLARCKRKNYSVLPGEPAIASIIEDTMLTNIEKSSAGSQPST